MTSVTAEHEVLSASAQLKKVAQEHEGEHIAFGDLVKGFKEGGFSILLITFSAPTALPLPAIPGLTFVLSLPVLLLSLQIILGRRSPWVPEWLAKKEMKMSTFRLMVDKLQKPLGLVERVLKPRFLYLSSRAGEKLVGLACLICAISVALPFPLTNTIPSMGIVIMALGLMEKDGLVIKGGMLVGFTGVAIAFSVYFLGLKALTSAVETL